MNPPQVIALPPSVVANPRLGDWLRVLPAGLIEVRPGKVELGQGVLTALAQVAAEELDVSLGRVRMMPAVTGLSPDEGYTSGSLSVQHSGAALRLVCAEARGRYLAAAAARLGVPEDKLTVADGQILAPNGRASSYWELADAGLLDRPAVTRRNPRPRIAWSARACPGWTCRTSSPAGPGTSMTCPRTACVTAGSSARPRVARRWPASTRRRRSRCLECSPWCGTAASSA
jgi:CO/xanthine dehydrogenase Mo-binding subunit